MSDDGKRTVRFCHLAEKPLFNVGEVITSRQIIGIMGNTGQSYAPHVHMDIAKGWIDRVYRQSDFTAGAVDADLDEFPYFIGDDWLFGVEAYITTFPHDPRYIIDGVWKDHWGYDVVPVDRHKTIDHWALHWPRSFEGFVLRNDYDLGYGYILNIGYKR